MAASPAPTAALFLSGCSGLLLKTSIGSRFSDRRFHVRMFVFNFFDWLRNIGRGGLAGLRRDHGLLRRRCGARGDTLELEASGHQFGIRLERDSHAVVTLYAGELAPFLIQRVKRHVIRHAHVNSRCALALTFFIERAQQAQRSGFDRSDYPLSATMRTGDSGARDHACAQPLARHFQQPELADLADLHASAIMLYGVTQAPLDVAIVALILHVYEVDDNQPGEIAQAQLARDFLGGFEVRLVRRLLDGVLARGAA